MGIVVEVVGRGRKPQDTVVVDGNRLTIGTSYENQVILHDPYVSSHHAVVELDEQGRLHLNDTGSANGIRDRRNRRMASNNEIESGDEFFIGKTRIRVLLTSHQPAAALSLGRLDSLFHRLEHPAWVVFFAGLLGLITLFRGYFLSIEAFRVGSQFIALIALWLIAAGWALFWLLVARLAKHDGRYLQQLSITLWYFMLAAVLEALGLWVSFNVPGTLLPTLTDYLQWALPLYLLFWCNLYIALYLDSRKRIYIASSLTAAIVVVIFMTDFLDGKDFNPRPDYSAVLLPPSFQIVSPDGVDVFVGNSSKVFVKLDRKLEKESSQKNEED